MTHNTHISWVPSNLPSSKDLGLRSEGYTFLDCPTGRPSPHEQCKNHEDLYISRMILCCQTVLSNTEFAVLRFFKKP